MPGGRRSVCPVSLSPSAPAWLRSCPHAFAPQAALRTNPALGASKMCQAWAGLYLL